MVAWSYTRLTQQVAADGGTQTWDRDPEGQSVVYVDERNNVTIYNYLYGTHKGDLTEIDYANGGKHTYASSRPSTRSRRRPTPTATPPPMPMTPATAT
jgi:hypothetical protein